MKNSIVKNLTLAAFMMFAVVCLPSCGNSDGFDADPAFAQIDSLADFLIADLNHPATIDEMVNRLEPQTNAIKSYWYLNHKDGDKAQMIETACQDLSALADSLDGGSTVDMERCNEIRSAIDKYFLAKEYSEKYSNNKLYQNEMLQWLALEKELLQFDSELGQVANWGGTITRINVSGLMASLAYNRLIDYAQLHKDGKYASSEMSIADARTALIQAMEDANSLEDDMVDDPEFKKTLQSMRERSPKIVQLLDNWLAARSELCKAEGIADAHTAHFLEKTADRIMSMIEG